MVVCPRATKQGQIKEDLLNLPVTKLQRKMLNQAVVPDHVDYLMLNEGVRGGAGAVKSSLPLKLYIPFRQSLFACLIWAYSRKTA